MNKGQLKAPILMILFGAISLTTGLIVNKATESKPKDTDNYNSSDQQDELSYITIYRDGVNHYVDSDYEYHYYQVYLSSSNSNSIYFSSSNLQGSYYLNSYSTISLSGSGNHSLTVFSSGTYTFKIRNTGYNQAYFYLY